MNLEFCPVCKRLLMIKEVDGKFIGVCSCGFKRTSGIEMKSEEKINKKTIGEGFVLDKKDEVEKLSYEEKRDMKADF